MGCAHELVRLGVDVIVTDGGRATLAAREATTSIPIVVAVVWLDTWHGLGGVVGG